MHERGLQASCDAMMAGTWHDPYTSSAHDLYSDSKIRDFSRIIKALIEYYSPIQCFLPNNQGQWTILYHP